MIDHVTFGVADFERATAFYDLALAPLQVRRLVSLAAKDDKDVPLAGYGDDRPWFWIAEERATPGLFHVALTAKTPKAVDAFHAAALQAGGRDNGPPGLRPHYHAGYYAAFILDPDGHNIEAVCHTGI